ncbi:MAG: TetR family transcriptional regulator [Gemmatimonadaceae bacterium]|nr:TetR family transcriptional regulator [Gemmatimonadaceae bacterium]
MTTTCERILAAAVDLTTRHGWASLTMARLADDVGVSRQTVYNEVGGKDSLARAMVDHELGRFLTEVEAQFDRHPRDPVAAIAGATSAVLSRAATHPLLRAILSSDAGAQTDLLPLLTTDSGSLLEMSIATVARRLKRYPGIGTRGRAVTADAVVRVVLSHLTQPTIDVSRVTADVRWMAARLLATD